MWGAPRRRGRPAPAQRASQAPRPRPPIGPASSLSATVFSPLWPTRSRSTVDAFAQQRHDATMGCGVLACLAGVSTTLLLSTCRQHTRVGDERRRVASHKQHFGHRPQLRLHRRHAFRAAGLGRMLDAVVVVVDQHGVHRQRGGPAGGDGGRRGGHGDAFVLV